MGCSKRHSGVGRQSSIVYFKCGQARQYQEDCKEKTKLGKKPTQTGVTSHFDQQTMRGGPILDQGKRTVEIEFHRKNY